MTILQEFDFEIQPMKLVRGQGLEKLIYHIEQERGIISCAYTHKGVISNIWYQE